MTAEILCIGTELIMGQILNSNAQYLSQALGALGISVYYQVACGDNPERMKSSILEALSRSDILVTSGGLGPTEDDLSKEIVAEALGLPMVEDSQSLDAIAERFGRMGRPMAENNLKQAIFASGAEILPNAHGTAPGCIVTKGEKMVIQLPGPPRELIPMFETSVAPYLKARRQGSIVSRYLRIFGMGESDVATAIADMLAAQGDVTIAPYCSLGEVQLRVTVLAEDEKTALARMAPVIRQLQERLGSVIYAVTDNARDSMVAHVAEALLVSGQTLATAESLTGGMVASKLVDIPGISAVLMEGLVTYSNEAKVRLLGVSEETLRLHGAVSAQCAGEMAEGLRARSGVDIALSTTGIAGPDGGTGEKPVGLVYIGLSTAQGTTVKELRLSGGRDRIRNMTTLHALYQLLEWTKRKA